MKNPAPKNTVTIGEISAYAALDTWTLAKLVAELVVDNDRLREELDVLRKTAATKAVA